MRFMFRRRRKPKSKQVTLKDLKKDFDKNGEYRYVIVTVDTKKAICYFKNIQRRNRNGKKRLQI